MYLTVKHQVKQLSKEDYRNIKKLSHIAKNLANEAIYNVRQHYFQTKKYLTYKENNKLLKSSSNYKKLNSNMAQQIIMEVDKMFASFFALLELKQKGKYSQKVKLPQYFPKNGFTTLIIGFVRLNGNRRELNKNNILGIDFGINNLATCVTNTGKTFIIDGRKLKSVNQWYNKENARLQSIKDKQKYKKITNRQKALTRKRNNRVNEYISKSARMIINFCLLNDIGVLVCGYNTYFQRNSGMGKRNNQNFVNIPFGNLRNKLKYFCEFYSRGEVDTPARIRVA